MKIEVYWKSLKYLKPIMRRWTIQAKTFKTSRTSSITMCCKSWTESYRIQSMKNENYEAYSTFFWTNILWKASDYTQMRSSRKKEEKRTAGIFQCLYWVRTDHVDYAIEGQSWFLKYKNGPGNCWLQTCYVAQHVLGNSLKCEVLFSMRSCDWFVASSIAITSEDSIFHVE